MLVECSALHCIHIRYIETGACFSLVMPSIVIDNVKVDTMMSRRLVAMPITSSAASLATEMDKQKTGSILLVDHGSKPIGIVTERDIVRQACSQNLPLTSIPAALLMSVPLVAIEASGTLQEAVGLMAKHRIRHLAVRKAGNVIGILSVYDVMRHVGVQAMLGDAAPSIFSQLSSLYVE